MYVCMYVRTYVCMYVHVCVWWYYMILFVMYGTIYGTIYIYNIIVSHCHGIFGGSRRLILENLGKTSANGDLTTKQS